MSGNTLIGGNRPTRAIMEKRTWNLGCKTSQVEPDHGWVKPKMMMNDDTTQQKKIPW